MGFWGLEVEPGKRHPYHPDNVQGKLHLTQATLGSGSGKDKSVLLCSVGDKNPIYLCSLLPNKTECCPLNLEFDDDDDLVEFSVIGERSIHLSGYFEDYEQGIINEEDDSDGIDISETESDYSSDGEEDYEDDFIDDDNDIDMYRSAPNSGVVIEEIEDEEKPEKEAQTKRPKKKNDTNEDKKNAKKQIVVKGGGAQVPIVESEDEDGFPITNGEADEATGNGDQASNKKRKAKASEQSNVLESENKNKKKKKQKEKQSGEEESKKAADEQAKEDIPEINEAALDKDESSKNPDASAEKKKKKKKKKNKNQEAEGAAEKTVSGDQEKQKPDSISTENATSSQVRTYPNGLIVEELVMGKPDGKKASPGKQVSVHYIGKLQKNGKIFDSNIGRAPFKFRLGLGQVIKGWDVGVNGMRVGDKRRLTIPPAMGYGKRGAGGAIPPNAWLVFDVELSDVR